MTVLAFANLDLAGLCAMAILVGLTLPDGARDKRSARRRARYRRQVMGVQTERARRSPAVMGSLDTRLVPATLAGKGEPAQAAPARSVCTQAVRLDESGGSMSSGNYRAQEKAS